MTTGHRPSTPSPRGGTRGPLLLGVVTFAVVFLLIVGTAIGYLVLRPERGTGTSSGPTGTSSSSAPSGPPEPTAPASEERCWYSGQDRTSSNPDGRLRGGGLEFAAPVGFDGRQDSSYASFLTDPQTATAPVEDGWYSSLTVGEVVWQPGVEYPGDEAASERIFSCITTNGPAWGDVTRGRSVQDRTTSATSVDGMDAVRTDGEVRFGEDDLERTDATRIVVIVVDTPDSPSVFVALIAVGVAEHEEALEEAVGSLTGLSG